MGFSKNLNAISFETSKYLLTLATKEEDLKKVQLLRGKIFYGERFSHKETDIFDEDKFDDVCHHLMLICKQTKQVIGTYRVQSYDMASQRYGFYSSQEFNLKSIPFEILHSSLEIGRACIAPEYRQSRALFYLWKGLANYMLNNNKKYLFGCSSLYTQSSWESACTYQYFQVNKLIHPRIKVEPKKENKLTLIENKVEPSDQYIPFLLKKYLQIGSKICSLPAIDKEFKTIDFLTLLDIFNMDKFYCKLFFGQNLNNHILSHKNPVQ